MKSVNDAPNGDDSQFLGCVHLCLCVETIIIFKQHDIRSIRYKPRFGPFVRHCSFIWMLPVSDAIEMTPLCGRVQRYPEEQSQSVILCLLHAGIHKKTNIAQ